MTALTLTPPKAVVVHCIDPRFQKAFAEFIHNELKLAEGEYIPLTVPGSIASIGSGIDLLLPKNYKILKEQLEIVFENAKSHELRIVIINHQDCKAYEKIMAKLRTFIRVDIANRQREDLRFAANVIKQIAQRFTPQCKVELYMARIRQDNKVLFEEV